jgi:DNA polymerase I-like protein with 3'-5' exonuclease and polymerase domains
MQYYDFCPKDPKAVPSWGDIPAKFIIVGKSPGNSSRNPLRPIGERSFQILKPFLNGTFYFTNLVKTPMALTDRVRMNSLKEWTPILLDELRQIVIPGYTRILTLGTESSQVLCPGFSSLREDHGTIFTNPDLGCVVVPTFPFYIGANDPEKRRMIDTDLQRFFQEDSVLSTGSYEIVDLEQLNLKEEVFLDLETTGLDPHTGSIIMIGFGTRDSDHVQIVKGPFTSEDHRFLYEILKKRTLIGHNIAFDLSFLLEESKIQDYDSVRVKDTMIMASILGESILSLKHLVSSYTNRPGSRGQGGFEDPGYLQEDVLGTRDLFLKFEKRTKDLYITELLFDLIPKFVGMRSRGVSIDWDRLEKLAIEYTEKINEAKKQIDQLVIQEALESYFKKYPDQRNHPVPDSLIQKIRESSHQINWNSPIQVSTVLQKFRVPLNIKTPSGNYSVSEPVLREFAGKYPIVDALLLRRDLIKESEFLISYREFGAIDGRLHPRLSLVGTSTGRLSCSDPNLQQVPRLGPIKTLFISRWPDGRIGLIDLAQAELRVAALLSNDEVLAEALLKEDVHRFIASKLYKLPEDQITPFQRKKSKGVTFGLLYGGSPKGLAQRIGVEESEVRSIVQSFFGIFPKLNEYIEDQKSRALATGYSYTIFGRTRNLRTIIETEGEHSAERKAINSPIQGTASDIMLVILRTVFSEIESRGLSSTPIFGVHDSSIHDIAPGEITQMAEIVNLGFKSLNQTPLSNLSLWNYLPITGEFIVGKTWASVESTNEENYDPEYKYPCSNVD